MSDTLKELERDLDMARPWLSRTWRRWFRIPGMPFALGWDEWDAYLASAKKKHPVRYFLGWAFPIWCSRTWRVLFHDPWYWTKCRLWNRYNVVYCRDLPPTWVDRDHVMLHAAFQILKDFIDREQPWEFDATSDVVRESYGDERAATWSTLRELYAWWEARRKTFDDDDRDDEMLAKLVSVRRLLWT